MKQQRQPTSLTVTNQAIRQLTTSLMTAFHLDEQCRQVLMQQHQTSTLEEAIHQWLLEALITPDKQLGSLMIPTIATRFHRYIESLRREQ